MLAILQGEFFWGVIVGLFLSFNGGWVLAKLTVTMQQAQARKTIARFSADTIKNIQSIIKEMDLTRKRAKTIYHDYLALIEVEVEIYGRNREHHILLADEDRAAVRQFMSNVAIKRAEVADNLSRCYQQNNLIEQARLEGRVADEQCLLENANINLIAAQEAADRLADFGKDVSDLLARLDTYK
ncbi:hypothetical protein ACQU0X_11985 [Pseudovibrio ascidiaceicola]|uniref:hypothetical protein n=1 Tax=Pseudovibrio ascidiaceicola TaxID=285279 RepID=UPI003D359BFB